MNDKISKLMKCCGLGEVTAKITPVSGGLMHRMYKVRTDSGIYAVKRLNPEIMKRKTARENYATAEALEARLEEARIPMVAAMTLKSRKMQELDGDFFYIFPWQKGRITDVNTVTAEQCRKAGELLGKIHAIDSKAVAPKAPELSEIDFAEYARMAQEAGSPVAELLSESVELLSAAQKRLNEAREALPAIVSICDDDMDPKNVMWFRGKPFVIDLECLAYGNPVGAFVDLALQWAGMTNGMYSRENLEAFYEGYRSAYDNGFLAYDTLYGIAYTWVEWLEYNIRRALGMEGDEGEQQLGEREVRNTVARIRALGKAEEEICETLRELRVREMEGVFDKAVALMKTADSLPG
ncbi:MAG: aminoglycoside phosphotransferase family protein [Lachnospiraceae bacterium]|nr:aminoglycoside phosphotransferase family protein [Lachnospiraceae bacterium]